MNRLKMVIRITRAPFFTAVIVPTLVGTALAWKNGYFHWGYLLLTLIGIVCINAGLDMSNDYFDHVAGTDDINDELTPFSGGSRVIQEGVLAPHQVLKLSLLFYAVGIAVGLYLAVTTGWPVLLLGLIGVFLAFFHNAPPIRIYSIAPGLGEFAAGVGCGPLVVLGAYYVQTQRLSLEALLVSVPVGLLIAAVLYINEFPDVRADALTGKKTVPVAIGRERAVRGYAAMVIAAYAVIIAGVVFGPFPYPLLVSLLSLPLAYRGIQGARRFHSDTAKLVPTLAATIQVHALTGILLCVGYAIARVTQ